MLTCDSVLREIAKRAIREFILERMDGNKGIRIPNISIENPLTTPYGGVLPFEAYIKISDGAVVDKCYLKGYFNVQGYIMFDKLFKNDVGVPREDGWRF